MNEFLNVLEMGTWLELIATLLSLIFLILLLKEKPLAWPFGIVSSLIFTCLWFDAKLYMESALYIFYVFAGFYGWWHWTFGKKVIDTKVEVVEWKLSSHLLFIILGIVATLLFGYFLKEYRPDAAFPYFDSFTSIFALIATYMESKKVLSGWFYWIVLNPASVILYWMKDFNVIPWLMVFYSIMSVFGYLQWRKTFKAQQKSYV